MGMYNGEKKMIVSSKSWRQTFVDNEGGEEREKDGSSTSSCTTWRTCDSSWWTWATEPRGDGELVWLTYHRRNLQPEGERKYYWDLL